MEIVHNSVEVKFYFHVKVELGGFTALVNVECIIIRPNDIYYFQIYEMLKLSFLNNDISDFESFLSTPLPIEVDGITEQETLRACLYKKLLNELEENKKINNYINKQKMLIYTNNDLNYGD